MERDRWIVYPEYFDYYLSRRLGRKVPLSLATPSPTLEEVLEAIKKNRVPVLGVEYKPHPAYWIGGRGRVVIPKLKATSKHAFLLQIARTLKDVRRKRLAKTSREKKATSGVDKYLQRILQREKKKKRR